MEQVYQHKTHPFLKGLKIFGFIILGAIGVAFLAFIFGYFVMLLWNWLMPAIFELTTITFWQAVGIVILARLVFGGFKHGHEQSKKNSVKTKFFNHCKDEYHKESKHKSWKYFDDFWTEEGEEAYNNYIDRREEQEQK